MADPVVFADWANYPADSDLVVKRSLVRSFFSQVINRINDTPETWTGLAGEVLTVASTVKGPKPVSSAGNTAAKFGNKEVRGYKAAQVALATSDSITDTEHGGTLIVMSNSSSATLTVALNVTPASGVSTGFACEVLRTSAAAAVVIVGSGGLTLRNPDSHTKITAGGIARLQVIGTDLYFLGYTET